MKRNRIRRFSLASCAVSFFLFATFSGLFFYFLVEIKSSEKRSRESGVLAGALDPISRWRFNEKEKRKKQQQRDVKSVDLFLLVSTRFYRESGKTKRKKSDSEIRKKPSSRFSDCFFIFSFFLAKVSSLDRISRRHGLPSFTGFLFFFTELENDSNGLGGNSSSLQQQRNKQRKMKFTEFYWAFTEFRKGKNLFVSNVNDSSEISFTEFFFLVVSIL